MAKKKGFVKPTDMTPEEVERERFKHWPIDQISLREIVEDDGFVTATFLVFYTDGPTREERHGMSVEALYEAVKRYEGLAEEE